MTDTLKLDDFLPYRLSIASNRVSGAIATAYEALFGLRIPEWRLVAVLAEGVDMTQREIGHVTQMDKVTVSRAAIALVDRGLVARSMPVSARPPAERRTTAAANRASMPEDPPSAAGIPRSLRLRDDRYR